MAWDSDTYHGVLLVNKPTGMTSHDVVQRVRRIAHQRRVGHTGTLDPLAEGLLILCLGRATKVAQHLSGCDKDYRAKIRLGRESMTYDAEGVEPDSPDHPVPDLSRMELLRLLGSYLGKSRQQVPAYSAVKVRGKRLYRLARRGETVDLPERDIEISRIELLAYKPPFLDLEVSCSAGTYIRSLAHDIGRRLGCGGYLASLLRTSVGSLRLSDAVTLEAAADAARTGSLAGHVRSIEAVLPLAAVKVTDRFAPLVIHGRTLAREDVVGIEGDFDAGDNIVLKDLSGTILAVGTAGTDSSHFNSADGLTLFRYSRVLN